MKTNGFENADRICGVEYKELVGLNNYLKQNDAPCAVCHVMGGERYDKTRTKLFSGLEQRV